MSEIDILNLVSLSPLYFIHIYISTKIYLLSITKLSNRNIEHTYLHVHVEGGLAVVLLPPARAPRGSVHAARLHAPSHWDTCPAHSCRDKWTRVSSRLKNTCPDSLSTCHYSRARSQEHVSCLPVTNLVQRDWISLLPESRVRCRYIHGPCLSCRDSSYHYSHLLHNTSSACVSSHVPGHLLSWSYK